MKTRQFGFAAAVIGLGAIAMSAACADQPKPKCVSGRGEFGAKLTYKAGPESCKARKAEIFGVQSYNLKEPGNSAVPDLSQIPVAIQPVIAADHASRAGDDETEGHKLYALGKFDTEIPGDNDICNVTFTGVTDVDLGPAEGTPADPEDETTFDIPELPATSYRYEWSGVQFYVTASATGTYFKGSLKRTENKVECEYDVYAMYPSVGCGVQNLKSEKRTETTIDPKLCEREAPPDLLHGNPVGSSINPDFLTSCQDIGQYVVVHSSAPTEFLCLPSSDTFPSLRP